MRRRSRRRQRWRAGEVDGEHGNDWGGRAIFTSTTFHEPVSSQCVFPRKCLAALVTPKWLDSQMYPLVSLQIVVSVLTVSSNARQ